MANNGQEFLEMLIEEIFDGVLIDYKLPVIDGYEAIRKNQKTSNTIPTIALTADAILGDRKKMYRSRNIRLCLETL